MVPGTGNKTHCSIQHSAEMPTLSPSSISGYPGSVVCPFTGVSHSALELNPARANLHLAEPRDTSLFAFWALLQAQIQQPLSGNITFQEFFPFPPIDGITFVGVGQILQVLQDYGLLLAILFATRLSMQIVVWIGTKLYTFSHIHDQGPWCFRIGASLCPIASLITLPSPSQNSDQSSETDSFPSTEESSLSRPIYRVGRTRVKLRPLPPPRPTLEQIHAALNKIVEDERNGRAAERAASPSKLSNMEDTQFPHLVNYIPPGPEKK